MQKSIIESVAEVFPGVPHQYCQYHFLKNVGNAILSEKHKQLGTLIRDKEVKKEIEKIQREVEIKKKDNKIYHEYVEKLVKLDKLLSSVVTDKSIKLLVKKLQYYYHFFNRLCMIFKDVKGCGKIVREQVEKRARRYLSEMRNRSKTDPELKKIVTRLEKYWNGLFYTYELGYIPSTNNNLDKHIKMKN